MEKKVVCPECQNDVELEEKDYVVGDIIECPFCGSELEVEDAETLKVSVIEEEK